MLNTALKDFILKLDQCFLGTRLPNPLYWTRRSPVGHQPLVGYLYSGPDKSSRKYSIYYGDRRYAPILDDGGTYMKCFDGHEEVISFFEYGNEEFNVTSTIINNAVLRLETEEVPDNLEKSYSRFIQFILPTQQP